MSGASLGPQLHWRFPLAVVRRTSGCSASQCPVGSGFRKDEKEKYVSD